MKILISVILFSLFHLLYSIFNLCNAIFRKLFLRSIHMDNSRALRGRILWKRKFHVYDTCSERDFLSFYSFCVNSEYVLKPNISLYSISKEEAIFIETAENLNIYSSDENPFLYFAQFEHSKYVIKMSIDSFHALADTLGNPAIPVIWMSNTGRCGSTLLCQVLEKVPGTLHMSEPDAPSNIDFMRHTNLITDGEHDRPLVSTIRLLCKPHPGTRMICIKTHNHSISLMKHVSRLYPSIKQIFMYRNCKETVASTRALLTAAAFTKISTFLLDCKWSTALKPFLKHQVDIIAIRKTSKFKSINVISKVTNSVGLFTYMWANYMLVAQEALSEDKNILAVKYEDFVSEKVKTCGQIFEKLGIDLSHLTTALTAFNQDSQRGTFFSISQIGESSSRVMTKEELLEADVILSCYNLPRIGEDFRLLT